MHTCESRDTHLIRFLGQVDWRGHLVDHLHPWDVEDGLPLRGEKIHKLLVISCKPGDGRYCRPGSLTHHYTQYILAPDWLASSSNPPSQGELLIGQPLTSWPLIGGEGK